jgi:hypothetical protein
MVAANYCEVPKSEYWPQPIQLPPPTTAAAATIVTFHARIDSLALGVSFN